MPSETFFVRIANGTRYVEAKFLTDATGNAIVSPNAEQKTYNLFDANGNFTGTNTNGYLIVPANFDMNTAIDFGKSVSALHTTQSPDSLNPDANNVAATTMFINAFRPVGWFDLQT